jgi:hypothetical protein
MSGLASESTAANAVAHEGWWTVAREGGESGEMQDIFFGRTNKPDAPPELLELRNRVDATLCNLQLIYAEARQRAVFDDAFDKLVSLAILGLTGKDPAVREANAALDSLQSEVTNREAGRIKNGYMLTLGKWALGFGVVLSLLYFLCTYNKEVPPGEIYRYRRTFLVLTGCMAGAWASFASRKVVLGFFDLANLESDRIDPALRLIFAGALTTFLVLIFSTGFATLKIGDFIAADAISSGSTALLLGALCGLSEQALPAAMMARAKSFLDAGQAK